MIKRLTDWLHKSRVERAYDQFFEAKMRYLAGQSPERLARYRAAARLLEGMGCAVPPDPELHRDHFTLMDSYIDWSLANRRASHLDAFRAGWEARGKAS